MKIKNESDCHVRHLCEPMFEKLGMTGEQRMALAHYLETLSIMSVAVAPSFRQQMVDAMAMASAMLSMATGERDKERFLERVGILWDYQALHDVPHAETQA
jgi:tellurite resistance protein